MGERVLKQCILWSTAEQIQHRRRKCFCVCLSWNGRVRKASPYERWCKIHYSVSCPPVKTITLWRQQLQFSHIKMLNSHVKMAAQLPQNYLNPLVGKWLGAVNPSHTRQSKYFSYCFPLAWSIWHTHVPGNSSILDTVNHIQKMLNFYIQWVVSYS